MDAKRLILSRRGYRSHLTKLLSTAGEILERCKNQSSETDDIPKIADLIEQLGRKKTILLDLDKQISTGIGDDDLEAEILESEEIQSDISSTIARVKRLMEKLQAPPHSSRPSLPLQVLQTDRPPSAASSDTQTETLPTPPQSPDHQEDTHHDVTEHVSSQGTHNQPQRLHSMSDVPNASSTEPREPHYGTNSAVRLPRLDLPTFSGDALEWQSFWDGFDAAVNSNQAISSVQKLNYLRSQLQGDASHVIAGFSLTNASYEHSVTLLKDRYGQPQKLITAHMQALLDLPNPSNTLSSLQSFHDAIERHMRSLSTLGKYKSVDSYGDLLVPIILNKLPQKTRKNMVREHDSNEWNLNDLQEAIRKEVRVFESEFTTNHFPQSLHPTATFHAGARANTNPSKPNSNQRTCAFCKGSHPPIDCKVVVDSKARKDLVAQRNLCFNCLGRHKVNVCSSKHRCRKCHRKHHTSLCPEGSTENQDATEEPVNTSTTLNTIVSTATSLHLASNNICLLKTALATVSASDIYVEANILFDEGSQRSFISKGLADCLQVLPHGSENLSISTFGTETSRVSKLEVATIHLHTLSGQTIPLTVLIVPTIAAPIQNLNKKTLADFPHLRGLHLAQPVTSTEQFTINLLIGADHYWDVVEDHIIKGKQWDRSLDTFSLDHWVQPLQETQQLAFCM